MKMNSRMRRLLVLLAVTVCLAPAAPSQEARWDALIKSGKGLMEARQYAGAEKAFREAVAAARSIGPNDARIATSLLFTAQAVNAQSRNDEADDLARQSVQAMDMALKHVKPKTAEQEFYIHDTSSRLFDGAADVLVANHKLGEAEALYKRVILISENASEDRTPKNNEDWLRSIVQTTTGAKGRAAEAEEKLAKLYFQQQRYSEAAPLYERASQARELDATGNKLYVAGDLGNQAVCLAAQGLNQQAERLFQRALGMFEHFHAEDNPEAARLMQNYAVLLKSTGRNEEAKAMSDKAKAILDKQPAKAPATD